MPQQITRLRVFISCPSNLDAERGVIAGVLQVLSTEFSEDRGIEFSVFHWKKDAIPGVNRDVQTVIASQVEYDLYIGILGTVFGTPTATAGSGTEEEFNEAYAKFQNDSTHVRVLFYFKDFVTGVFQIDPDQLVQVQSFRKKLGPKGVLFHDFLDLDELRDDFRTHIRGLVRREWEGSTWRVRPTSIQTEPPQVGPEIVAIELAVSNQASSPQEPGNEMLGLLEFAASGIAASNLLTQHLSRLSILGNSLSTELSSRTDQIPSVSEAGLDVAREFYDGIAELMRDYQLQMQQELPIYEGSAAEILRTLKGISYLFFEEKTGSRAEIEALLESFDALGGSLRKVRPALQSFRQIIENIPSYTYALRSARKHLARVIDDYVSSYTIFIGSAEELIQGVRQRLSGMSS